MVWVCGRRGSGASSPLIVTDKLRASENSRKDKQGDYRGDKNLIPIDEEKREKHNKVSASFLGNKW